MTATECTICAVFGVPALFIAWLFSPPEMSDEQRFDEAGYPPAWEQPAEIEG